MLQTDEENVMSLVLSALILTSRWRPLLVVGVAAYAGMVTEVQTAVMLPFDNVTVVAFVSPALTVIPLDDTPDQSIPGVAMVSVRLPLAAGAPLSF